MRTKIFNRSDQFVEGWHWAFPSNDLKRGEVRPVNLLGRELIVYRGEDGQARAMDAYCPHMGAHLAEGRVDGKAIRCFFHDWKFDADGCLVEVPCLKNARNAPKARIRTWPTQDHLGLIWVWPGEQPKAQLPYVPELKRDECDVIVGPMFTKACHPNVVMINAIDEHHFNTVHHLPVDLHMKSERPSFASIKFSNATPVPSHLTRTLGRFYQGPLTYSLCYHFGSTGTVTLGPDRFHFHIMFALRLAHGGSTEGRTIVVTKKRRGLTGSLFNGMVLRLTKIVGDYFAGGDTRIFESIRFDFKTPTKADHAIIDFVRYVEEQPGCSWERWQPVDNKRRPEVVNG